MRNYINITESYLAENLSSLKAVKISDINIDEALWHFDLPSDIPRAEMRAAFKQTKLELLNLFKGMSSIVIYRGLIVEPDWKPEDRGLGKSWSWDVEGAMLGSGVKYWTNTPNKDMGVILKGEISPQYIDWEMTIAVNAFHEDEREIVVKEGSPVMVKAIVMADKFGVDPDHDTIATPNQTFTS